MKREKYIELNDYLSRIQGDWEVRYPGLERHLQLEQLCSHEWLHYEPGCSYLVLEGVLGKYKKKSPQRYVIRAEPILTALEPSPTRFKALSDALLYKIDQQSLYELHWVYTDMIQLNHRIWLDHHKYLEYRTNLLEQPKGERLDIFRKDYQAVIPLITRKELAQYLSISEEYLRQLF
ncbi:hypothetical protein SAMN05660841_01688 [Sphingobacterium nematocida]|uniref:cAMP-binding domain of CRP or a regulatory subunit of cAMP-dependent protein kinases n=1 Tax=Sphingobacterium nematocida TaxID=1513896 RepID=A0A1T5CZV1_9SPHI|nr:hypothetical protein [Sphingobacterium nematocida]SKB64929.1 hypothetical protein SAMN05660841_01688 [Sphingobacterium nematocida]